MLEKLVERADWHTEIGEKFTFIISEVIKGSAENATFLSGIQ